MHILILILNTKKNLQLQTSEKYILVCSHIWEYCFSLQQYSKCPSSLCLPVVCRDLQQPLVSVSLWGQQKKGGNCTLILFYDWLAWQDDAVTPQGLIAKTHEIIIFTLWQGSHKSAKHSSLLFLVTWVPRVETFEGCQRLHDEMHDVRRADLIIADEQIISYAFLSSDWKQMRR